MAGPLGRREPTDWEHVERYPLRALAETPTRVPVVIGVNWYTAMDAPAERNGRWWLDEARDLGTVRGGHCVCLRPYGVTDAAGWWDFYDQGQEGACVGFGWSRAMSLLNRKRYAAEWLYHQAQLADEWASTPPEEGTSVRAGGDVLRSAGHMVAGQLAPAAGEGISAFRWATTADEIVAALGFPASATHVPLLNSWGRGYPRTTWTSVELLARLLHEEGEFAVPTDR